MGHLSVATVLDAWVRDWREQPWIDTHLPRATVDDLAAWLRRWLDHACDHHPRIGEFGVEMRDLRRTLRSFLREAAESDRRREYPDTTCRRCDLRGVLIRDSDDVYIQCGGCGALYTEAELAG